MNGFLPLSRGDMEERGIKQFDFIYVTGDAYVDHPSFGAAIVTRLLEYSRNNFSARLEERTGFQNIRKAETGVSCYRR